MDIRAYRLNLNAVQQAYDTLSRQTMELTSFSDRKITGTIEVQTPGSLVFSIAKEDGRPCRWQKSGS